MLMIRTGPTAVNGRGRGYGACSHGSNLWTGRVPAGQRTSRICGMKIFRLPAVTTVLALALALVAAGCGTGSGTVGGSGGDASGSTASTAATSPSGPVDNTINLTMVDVAFKPTTVTVKAGTTVRFVFKNDGDIEHEAAFGDEATQAAVESGKAKRDGPSVNPHQTKDYVRRFDAPGALVIGCHVAGHYAAGMKVQLKIE